MRPKEMCDFFCVAVNVIHKHYSIIWYKIFLFILLNFYTDIFLFIDKLNISW